jgi:hypothetical protein
MLHTDAMEEELAGIRYNCDLVDRLVLGRSEFVVRVVLEFFCPDSLPAGVKGCG